MPGGTHITRNEINRRRALVDHFISTKIKSICRIYRLFSHSNLWFKLSVLISCIILCFLLFNILKVSTVVDNKLSNQKWRVGSSRIDITPTEQVWLSGFSSRNRTTASLTSMNSTNKLYARVLAIYYQSSSNFSTSNEQPLILVSLDVVGIDKDFSKRIYQAAEQRFSIHRENLRICSSHTHSGPVVGDNLRSLVPDDRQEWKKINDYSVWLEDRILTSIQTAILSANSSSLSSMHVSSTNIQLSTNRRQVPESMYTGEVRGLTEDRVPVLWFEHNERIISGFYGFAAHASVITEGYSYSGDYPGFASRNLEEHFADSTWLFVASCGGDQNIYPRGSPYLAEQYGHVISEAVLDAMKSNTEKTEIFAQKPVSIHSFLNLSFAKQYTRREVRKRSRTGKAVDRRSAISLLEQMNEKDVTDPVYSYPIGIWSFGEVTIAFLGGEPTVAYCSLLREVGVFWVVGYCEDVMGYVGSADIIRDGGREGGERAAWYYGLPAAWDVSIEQKIISRVRQMLQYVDNF